MLTPGNDVSQITIGATASIKDALKQLDRSGRRILFVVDDDLTLKATITDGDIRRHILRDGDIQKSVDSCYNLNPITIDSSADRDVAIGIMLERKVDILPVMDSDGRLLDYMAWSDLFGEKARHTKTLDVPVVIMAGGKGTRLDPFTKILPKPLIPVGEKPIVENIMDRFHEYGASDFYLTINYKGEMIRAYFDSTETPYEVNYIREDEFMGTAGSLSLLPGDFSETFILSNCDVVIETNYASLVDFHKKNDYPLTMVASMQHYRIPYGVIDLNKSGSLNSITEKPEYDFMVNTGLYVINREVLEMIPAGRQFHMTDLVDRLVEVGREVGVYPVGEKAYIDIGQWDEYRKNMERFISG